MEYALKERIGKPELFTGRKEVLAFFLKWINDIKEEKSQSTAMQEKRSRKTGKRGQAKFLKFLTSRFESATFFRT